jgi:putative sugar O-methyltransferase
MLADLKGADPIYRPTRFWERGLSAVVADLKRLGWSGFRRHPSAKIFYAPLYARGSYSSIAPIIRTATRALPRRVQAIADILDGIDLARQDYRVVRASCMCVRPFWQVSESTIGEPVEQFMFAGVRYSRSSLNYLRALHALGTAGGTDIGSVLEIGGGFGTLGELLTGVAPCGFYVNVDIPPLAAVSSYYLTTLLGADRVWTYERSRDAAQVDLDDLRSRGIRAAVLCSWQLPKVVGTVDLFANLMSFQEMEPEVVANYARLVTSLAPRWVLLRNSRYGKPGVLQPVTTDWTIGQFPAFRMRVRDHLTFGDSSPDERFISEVVVLERLT